MTPTQNLIAFFETLSPESIERIGEVYASDAYFKDPFNEVRGLPEVQRLFEHMFVQVDKPRFIITEAVPVEELSTRSAVLIWEFRFSMKGQAREELIRGASHVRFNESGHCNYHRDYWDAAEELYEKIPVLGGLMRFLKRRVNAG